MIISLVERLSRLFAQIREERQVLVRRPALERRRSQSIEMTPYRISSFRAIFNRISGEEGWIIL
jgi:hypothetical protein